MTGKAEKARTRTKTKFALGWVNETTAETDEEGNVVEPARQCFVLMDLPPNIDPGNVRNRDAIRRACRAAVYDGGLEEYGNKQMVVLSYDEFFDVPFQKQEVVRLCAPGEEIPKPKPKRKRKAKATEEPKPEAE